VGEGVGEGVGDGVGAVVAVGVGELPMAALPQAVSRKQSRNVPQT